MLDYYAIPAEHLSKYSKVRFHFVDTHDDLCWEIAKELVALIKSKAAQGQMTKVILPVGPLNYRHFAELCNRQAVSCESLVVFCMDEYCSAEGMAIPKDHPLSFRAFWDRNLLTLLDPDKRLPPDQLIVPNPADPELVDRKLEAYGPIDVTYGGFGINGHFAFNVPCDSDRDHGGFHDATVRMVQLGEADIIQMAIAGTGGNIEVIPPRACTLGIRLLLSAELVHLTFMRSWHAGVLRRALFGPITSEFPGSLVQSHPNVKATVTSVAAALPLVDLLQRPGE